ncbi:MAG: BREX-1 system adenine-specific DNA-methyltransferase PglX [Nitrospirota bacterium]|nr:BREX-1 system adenine-specific DNA-methyltransferase PglX [Nitrospirota bacterium]
MRIVPVLLLCAAGVLGFAFTAQAEFYKWTDRDGREFYTNEREKIPAEYRHAARSVEVHDERVSVGGKPAAEVSRTAPMPEHRDKNGRGEAYWRKRAENLRRQIREQEAELELLNRQDREDQANAKRTSAKARKKAGSARDKKRAKIEKKIALLRHDLDVELPEEARKADAYPGWLRD